jgi:hypothetical protein
MDGWGSLGCKKEVHKRFNALLLQHQNILGKRLTASEFLDILLDRYEAGDWKKR